MSTHNLSLCFLALLGTAGAASGQWTATTYGMPTGYQAKAIALVDQSSNGWPDLVIGATGTNDRIYRRTGPTHASLTLLQSYTAGGLTDIAVGRLDLSGQPDIASSHASANVVRVRRFPSGLQTLALPTSFRPLKVIMVDLDNDKDLDLVTVGAGNIRPYFARNNGSGVFTAMTTVTNLSVSPSRPLAVVAGDFNHDGKNDLVVPRTDGNVSFFRNTTVGAAINFATAQTYSNPNTRPFDVCAGDFNGDGWLDFATANAIGSCSVFINQGPPSGTWTTVNFTKTTYSLGSPNVGSFSICCGDYDCDGDTDLFLALRGTSKIATLRNNGSGAFVLNPLTATGAGPTDIACGDLDRNGHLDLGTAGQGGATGSVTKHVNTNTLPLKPHIYIGGIPDNFSTTTPTGTEHACPRAGAFTTFVTPRRNFDQASSIRKFGHTFPNVGAGHQFLPRVVRGRLTLRLRGDSISAANDTIGLGWHGSPTRMVFRKRIVDMPGVTTYGSGSNIFLSLDLANLPGGINLIPKINQNKSLDIFAENSTRVDSAQLQLWTCTRVRCLFSLKQTPLVGGTNWTIAAGGAASGSWIFFFMGSQVAPGPVGPWGQMCLPFPLFYLGAQFAPNGGASLTFPLPSNLPVPCNTVSTQALSWTPASNQWCLSNTWTAQLFN